MLFDLFSGNAFQADKIKLLMLDKEKRTHFLEELEEICYPIRTVDSAIFSILAEIICEFIEEAAYDEDYNALCRIYRALSHVGIGLSAQTEALDCSQIISFKSYMDGSRFWRYEMFWVQTTVDLVRGDMHQWAKIMFIFRENKIKDTGLFGSMSSSQVRTFMVTSRIQAIVSSMRSVDMSNEFIQQVLAELSAQFGLKEIGINITNTSMNPVKPFLLRLLRFASEVFLPALSQRAKQVYKKHSTNREDDAKSTIFSTISLANSRVEIVENPHTVPLGSEIGYCPALELIFSTYVHAIKAHGKEENRGEKELLEQLKKYDGRLKSAAAANEDAPHSHSLTRCMCGGAIESWEFLDGSRGAEEAMVMSPQLRSVLAAIAAGNGDAATSAGAATASAPGEFSRTRARSNSGRFALERIQSGRFNVSNVDAVPESSGPQQLVGTVVSRLMCERCYRHLMSPPLCVVADTIQCTGLCPLSAQLAPMPDETVSFETIFDVEQSEEQYIDYAELERGDADQQALPGTKSRSIDFALFDKNLSALLKKQDPESAASAGATNSRQGGDDGSIHQAPDNLVNPAKPRARHGIEGHRIRNSRDLTKIHKSTSVASTLSSASEGKSEELHVLDTVAARASRPDNYHQNRALPPDPTLSPVYAQSAATRAPPFGLNPSTSAKSEASSNVGGLTSPVSPSSAGSVTSASSTGFSIYELVPFVLQLWDGINVKVVYSSKPLVEKVRVVYLRATTEKATKHIRDRMVPIGTETTASHRHFTHTALLDALSAATLQICWGRRGVMGSVSYSAEKCVDVDTVKHIKVGTGAWAQCINIGSSTGKTLVLKLEDDFMFNKILDGITALVASRKTQTS